jgi:thiol-disulfide isomerase/thioredoxin
MTVTRRLWGVLAALALCATGAAALAAADDDKTKVPFLPSDASQPAVDAPRSESSLTERFAQIRAEYEAQRTDVAAYARRMVDIAASSPADPAARDALIWVINKPERRDVGAYGDEFARAVALLVRHHGDDPEAIRVSLGLSNVLTYHRDALLMGFYAAAKGREAKGLARLALAQYLEKKARGVTFARKDRELPKGRERLKVRYRVPDEQGRLVEKVIDSSDEQYAYYLHLSLCDPEALRAEAERLYEEVIADSGGIPYITVQRRMLEARLKEAAPDRKPLADQDRHRLEQRLARTSTLGETAEARLDEMHNLAVGKPAPEIVGLDFEGKPLKLSDYRGKVVVLVFWGTWCGPCMAEVPHERELVERHKDRPFALLGIDCDEDKKTAVKVMDSERITWPNWHDGAPGSGPIAKLYHIRRYATVYVLDAQGIIRHRDGRGSELDRSVDNLLKELETKNSQN